MLNDVSQYLNQIQSLVVYFLGEYGIFSRFIMNCESMRRLTFLICLDWDWF